MSMKAVKAAVKPTAHASKPVITTDKRPHDQRLKSFLFRGGARPAGTLESIALDLLRIMDELGNFSPDALFERLTESGKDDPVLVRQAVDEAVRQVKHDHGLT